MIAMLDLAVLGLLRREPRHGYDLRLRLAELGFGRVSFGALYPALRRLERRGWIEALRPVARRKAYRLTGEGRIALDGLLIEDGEEPDSDGTFAIRLAFFEFIPADRRLAILRRRRSQLVARLGAASQALRHAMTTDADPYTLALVRHNVASIESDIAWLDELVAMTRTDTRRNPS